ncbi:MAG: RNA polymerase sigma factor [Gammaproteobacteria bacterium]
MHPDHVEWFLSEIMPHRVGLERALARRGLQRADIDEICQEALVRILTRTSRVRPAAPKAFLFRTAVNFWIDRRRKADSRRLCFVPDMESVSESSNELAPERYVIGWHAYSEFSAALRQLTPRQRQVFWLRRVENVSLKGIARRLQVAPHTVEQHIRGALRTLRMRMAE